MSQLQLLAWGLGMGLLGCLVMIGQRAWYQPAKFIPENSMTIRQYNTKLVSIQFWSYETDKARSMIWIRILFIKIGFQLLW